ncbi:MAG: PKD domain-containing protein [Bacteroidetes bacterium]|nr:PKD domain-containing protein [Bacteroidota bacterium]
MNKIQKLLIAGAFLFSGTGIAQELKHCGTTEAMNKLFAEHPEIYQQYLQEEEANRLKDQEAYAQGYPGMNNRSSVPLYTIPVVFHIIHQNGTENITDAQIHDQMRILNEDYSKMNANNANTVAAFQSISADCQIAFKLAQKDPNGNCTNGIDRIYSAETNIGDDGSKLNPWPRNKYLNVWVVKTIDNGAAGYAYLPGTAFNPATDGIIILHNYIGSIGTGNSVVSHALTHEVGHYLNLLHCWGNGNTPGQASNCSADDNVTDTPNTIGWTSCNLSGATCGSALDNVQNFMEYSYCSTMFTTGQKNRMHNALNSTSAQRNQLSTTTNLAATGVSTPAVLCAADFLSNSSTNIVCAGDDITFTDNSWNGDPTSWSWSFPGGTPSTSADSNPTITYNTPGVYDVSLTVSNGSGSVSTTKTSYIIVNHNTAQYSNTVYSEGFETSTVPGADWNIKNTNSGSNAWEVTSTAAATGSKSVRILNASTYVGHVDELLGPSIDMTQIAGTTPTLTFKVAHAQKTAASADKLQFYVSTNCGQTWVLRKALTGASLSTAGVVASSFVPNASQWVTQSVNLNGYTTQTNLYYMFRFTSDGGNNIYIDDINLAGTQVGIEDEIANNLNFNVFPNPSTENTTISFDLIDKLNVDLRVLDVVGREVSVIYSGNLNNGEYKYNVNEHAKLAAGVYFVKLTVDNRTFTKKLIVE